MARCARAPPIWARRCGRSTESRWRSPRSSRSSPGIGKLAGKAPLARGAACPAARPGELGLERAIVVRLTELLPVAADDVRVPPHEVGQWVRPGALMSELDPLVGGRRTLVAAAAELPPRDDVGHDTVGDVETHALVAHARERKPVFGRLQL